MTASQQETSFSLILWAILKQELHCTIGPLGQGGWPFAFPLSVTHWLRVGGNPQGKTPSVPPKAKVISESRTAAVFNQLSWQIGLQVPVQEGDLERVPTTSTVHHI